MNANESGKIHRAASGLRGSSIRHIFPPLPPGTTHALLTGLRAYRDPTARTGTLVEKDMKILWQTHTVSATGDYCLHRNDKLSVYIWRMPGGFGVLLWNIHLSPFLSACACEDASLVSLDIWLLFYPVPRIVSQMLCDRSTLSYQSSFTLTQAQLRKHISSISARKNHH